MGVRRFTGTTVRWHVAYVIHTFSRRYDDSAQPCYDYQVYIDSEYGGTEDLATSALGTISVSSRSFYMLFA